MKTILRWSGQFVIMSFLAGGAWAQSLAPAPPPIEELPGAGRPIEVQATRARREALVRRVGPGVIAVPAATARNLEVDVLQDNDFRQNDYFFYLTGLESPDAWLVITVAVSGSAQPYLFLPVRNPAQETWTGLRIGPGSETTRLTGIPNVHQLDSLDRVLARLRRANPGPLFTLLYAETIDNQRIQQWLGSGGGQDVRNVVPVLDSARLVKDDAELVRLRRAIDITAEGQRAAMQAIRPGMYEYEIEALVEYTSVPSAQTAWDFPRLSGADQIRRRCTTTPIAVRPSPVTW